MIRSSSRLGRYWARFRMRHSIRFRCLGTFPHLEMPDIFNDSLNRFVTIVPDLTYVAGGE